MAGYELFICLIIIIYNSLLGYPIVDDPKHGGLQQTTLKYAY